jgi:hypothetical protein
VVNDLHDGDLVLNHLQLCLTLVPALSDNL